MKAAGYFSISNTSDKRNKTRLLLPAAIMILLFSYKPMYCILIAFHEYSPGVPILSHGANWVGLKHFESFYSGIYFTRLLGNTIQLSVARFAFGFFPPITLAN